MFTILVVIHVIACTVLVVTVLLQQGKGAEVGAVFGSSEAIFGSTGPATLLSKITTASAVIFMLTSLSLTYLSIHSRGESVMHKVQQSPVVPAKMPEVPGSAKNEMPVPAGQQTSDVKPAGKTGAEGAVENRAATRASHPESATGQSADAEPAAGVSHNNAQQGKKQ